jgi:hypothetical protein
LFSSLPNAVRLLKTANACGFGYVNPTVWVNPSNAAACRSGLHGMEHCFAAIARHVRAGMIGKLWHEWRKANIGRWGRFKAL